MRRILHGPWWYRVTSCEAPQPQHTKTANNREAGDAPPPPPAVVTPPPPFAAAASKSSSFYNRKLTTVSFPPIHHATTQDDDTTTTTKNDDTTTTTTQNDVPQQPSAPTRGSEDHRPPSGSGRARTRRLYAAEILHQRRQQSTADNTDTGDDELLGADQELLPFPPDVCGACTCHGLEPLQDYSHLNNNPETPSPQKKEVEVDLITGLPLVMVMKKINQDRGGVFFPYGGHTKTALFCIYDGHGEGGEEVAAHTMGQVEMRLQRHPQFDSNIAEAFKDTFLSIDSSLQDALSIDSRFCGSTACLVLVRDNTLHISNIGDSRAVLSRRIPLPPSNNNSKKSKKSKKNKKPGFRREAVPLTRDQNPESPSERRRIERAGGYVSASPEPGVSSRVWIDEANTYLGLAMSRSVGDTFLKQSGVIAEPVVTRRELSTSNNKERDEFLVLASDGVWEYLDSDEVVRVVGAALDQGHDAHEACRRLILTAASRWKRYDYYYRDDITAIVVRLGHHGLFDDDADADGRPTTDDDDVPPENESTGTS